MRDARKPEAFDGPRDGPRDGARVARLTESDWELFARMRLRALADSLGSNDPQLRREMTFTVAQWRKRLREHAQFVALLGGQPVGLIAAQRENAATVYLYSLWLDPAARGHRLARPLVLAVLDWARTQNARVVTLRVARENTVARGIYQSLGFGVASAPDSGPDSGPDLNMTFSVG